MYSTFYTFYLLSFVMCVASLRILIQYLNVCVCKQDMRERIKYTGILTLVIASAFQPYYASVFPNAANVMLAACVLVLLYDGTISYRVYRDVGKGKK